MRNGRKREPRVSLGARVRQPTSVDLFCGAGGFAEGLRQAGFHTVAANDFDPWAGATFDANHQRFGTKFILGDIKQRAVQDALLDAIRGVEIDVVVGGPPCQAFSQVRNHQRVIEDPRNQLYRHYVSMIAKIKPRVFVMENVPGLENLGGGSVRAQIIEDLALEGEYRVASRVVDAAAFGVPQTRLRVLFVGVRADLEVDPRFPPMPAFDELPGLERVPDARTKSGWTYRHARSLLNDRAFNALQDPADLRMVTVEQAIGDLTHLRPNPRLIRRPSNDPIEYAVGPSSAYQRARRAGSAALYNADVPSIREDTVARLAAIPPGGNFRDLPEALSARYLSDKKWGPELGRANLSRKYFFAYRKLHADHFSWTLNTKADCVFHYSFARALTVREFARLHSFDDTYHFMFGDRHSRYRQVGNAVPPLLGREIGEAMKGLLDEHDSSTAGMEVLAAD
jgi:DNA (cytosine-5)-methyltransferase 1